MSYIDPRYLEHQRKRFTRNNAQLYIRHDAWRFAPPGAPRYSGKDVVRYLEPDPGSDRRSQAAADNPARATAEFEAAERERLAFRHEVAKFRLDWELFKFALHGFEGLQPEPAARARRQSRRRAVEKRRCIGWQRPACSH